MTGAEQIHDMDGLLDGCSERGALEQRLAEWFPGVHPGWIVLRDATPVPVEVPGEVEIVRAALVDCNHGSSCRDTSRGAHCWDAISTAKAVLAKVAPLIAARVRAETQLQLVEPLLAHCHAAEANGFSEVPVSSIRAAITAAAVPDVADHDARVRAEERQRVAAMEWEAVLSKAVCGRRPSDTVAMAAAVREAIAAGSAVPVATPGPAEIASLPLEELPDWTDLAEAVGATLRNHEIGCSGEQETVMHWPDGRTAGYRDRLAIISGDSELPDYSKPPVATPTEPGRPLRVMEAHKLEDCTDPSTCWWSPHRMGERLQIDPAE